MTCPSCGSQLPDGTDFCPNCGSVIPADSANAAPAFNVNDAIFNGGSSDSFASPNAPVAPAKKSSGGMIIGIVAAVAVIALVGIYFLLNGKYMGTYNIDSMTITYQGETMTLSSSDLGISGDEMQIVVGMFNKVTLVSDGSKGSGKIKFSGDTVTLSDSEITIKGTYDKKAKTITIPFSEFTKYLTSSDLSDSDQQALDMFNMFDEVTLVFKKK
ncbi:MAG: zinc ribbon domain-containing protein [Lachnospiraceae bacterium]|nr:zinc ribbon domain-containing protein [Lachnospiraceae bacterium]